MTKINVGKCAFNINTISFHLIKNRSAYTWACLLYALFITSIGACLPVTMAWDLSGSQNVLDRYLEFYIFLYSVGICYFIFYHLTANTLITRLRFTFFSIKRIFTKIILKQATITSRVTEVELVEMQGNNSVRTETDNENETLSFKTKQSGHFGLKCGVKAAVVVLVIIILMELSTFVQGRINGMNCHVDAKGIYAVVQLVYVVLQTFFVLRPDQENIERYSMVNHFGVAHLIGTTICMGFLLTAYDCLLQLHSLQQTAELSNSHIDDVEIKQNLPTWVVQRTHEWKRRETQNDSVDLSPCSLKSYLDSIQTQVKPFTHTITMFYVYCCSILLFLLCFHIRKRLHKSASISSAFFKKIINLKVATFSSGAGLSLIVLSIIISVLTLNANDNVYAEIFLLFIHAQASAVGLIALWRIADVPCRRKSNHSKYPTIYLIFFFFVVLAGALEIIGKCKELSDESNYMIVLEIVTDVLDIFQAFLHGLLILVGFMVEVSETAVINEKMPKNILIHLAASNFAALLSVVFNSKTVLFHNIERILKVNVENEVNARIAWSVLASILNPCEEFNRFTTIIYLIKLYKMWTVNESGLVNKRNISRMTVATTATF